MSKITTFIARRFVATFFIIVFFLTSSSAQAATLAAPNLKSAIGGIGQVTLTWDKVSTATNYSVKFGTTPANYSKTVSVGDVSTFTASGLANDTVYYFVVVANNALSTGNYSRQMSARTQLPAPYLRGAAGGVKQIFLTWDKVPGATKYFIKYGTASLNYTKTITVGDVGAYTVTGLANETNYYVVIAAGSATSTSVNSRQMTARTWSPTTPAPPKVTMTLSASAPTIPSGASTTLSWTSANATSLYVDNGIGAVANSGTVSISPKVTTTYTITATGALGSANAKTTVYVTATPEVPPEGTFGGQYSDLIPIDSTVTKYDVQRFAVVRGEVKDKSNTPLSQVMVTIDGKPQYGTAKTDASGRFSIPVDINGTLNLVFVKNGFITSHRQVQVTPNDIAISETVTLLAEDTKATVVTLDGNANTIVVHQSTPVTDVSGTRTANVVISGDNKAYAVDKNGNNMLELTKLNLRATEFSTPASMPAVLPPTSAFTYCVELKVDGVERVKFKDPVVVYVDNFLGFDVGEIVPVGYYDRDRGVWVPSENGRVVKLLDTNSDGIVDALDATGDGVKDDLNKNGDFSDEVKGLNDPVKYAPNKTFWRVSLTHFSPWDLNWPVLGPAAGAVPPNATGTPNVDQQKDPCKDDNKSVNSYVNCRSRIYHEDIAIPGTDLTLHYASNRVPDYKTIITVPASGATVPPGLKRIVVRLDLAGRSFEKVLPALANQTVEFSWDGRNFKGQKVDFANAVIATDFVYNGVYGRFGSADMIAAAFGQPGVSASGIVAREEFIFTKKHSLLIQNQSQTREGLAEGWTLSNHHYLSPKDISTLYEGSGNVVRNNRGIITTTAGTGAVGYSGDGGPAIVATMAPSRLAVDLNGNIYVTESGNHRIRKIDTDGIITTIAGTGQPGFGGDGGPAIKATLRNPGALAVDQDGNIYFVDQTHNIRKIDVNGIITTIAGDGLWSNQGCGSGGKYNGGYSGDGGSAIYAKLCFPNGIAVDQSGNIYIADTYNQRIRKIDINGIIRTIAGTSSTGYSGDGGPATAALLFLPVNVAVDQSGNTYILDAYNHRIRKVDANGIIITFAGAGSVGIGNGGYSGDGGPATAARLNFPRAVAVDQKGEIYFIDSANNRIRNIDVNGIITTIAGSGVLGYSGDGGPATAAMLNSPGGITVDQSGNIYIADSGNYRIRKIEAALFTTATPGEEIAFLEEGLGYTFSLDGKHKQTVDLDTKKVLEQFGYDASGRLISSTGLFNNEIKVERNGAGVPTAIVSPDGVRTNLTIDANNRLTHITYPDGKFYKFEYSSGGLLTKETEPKGNFFTHTFDANGRITDVEDQEGGHEKFGRQVATNSGDITTTVTSGEGDVVTYLDQVSPGGAVTSTSSVSGITKPSIQTRSSDDLTSKTTLPDLTVLDSQFDLDSENKFKYLKSQTITVPSGLKAQMNYGRTYTDTNTDGKKDLITRTASLNTKTSTVKHDVLTSTFTASSPLSRTVTAVYDPTTLLTSKVSVPGLLDTTYTYDLKGRAKTVSTGTRTMSFVYDLAGNLESVTDPRNNRTSYTYDAVGRTKLIHRPDSTEIRFDYDDNGNMTVLKNPSNQNHGYIYNNVNLATSYKPPLSPSTTYVYDKERRLKEVNFPSGKQIRNIYAGVLLKQVQTPEGNIDPTYLPSGQLSKITKGGESITNTYDGSLPKTVTSAGTVAETLAFTFNNDLKLSGFTYAGATNSFGYDNDGLLTSSGRFTITRNVQNGLPTAVTGGALNLTRTFNGYAEVTNQTQTVNSNPAGSWTLTYNNNGQIATKVETVAGITTNYVYTYDTVGRLTNVEKDGTQVEEYRYTGTNPLGTRTYEMNSLRGIAGRNLNYNAEDQLLSVGGTTYQYDADGFLSKKTDGVQVTTYNYSSRGELLSSSLPDGRTIEYINDPMGRRIAKKINGTIVEKYLWAGLTQLLAVYDGSNNLLMRFEYADGRMPNVMTKGAATYYMTYDQVGSLRVVSDSTGTIVKRIDYDSFGNIIVDTAPVFTVPFGFAGGLHDRDVGLVRFGYRDYDPATGRWTAKDPIGFAAGDVDLYGYVLSDPINFVDPYGLEETKWWEYSSEGISAAAGGVEKASQVSEYGHFYNEIGPKPISSTALQPNPFTKWIKPAAGAGNALTVVTTGLEVGGICLLSRDSVEKKSAKIAFAIGANATGYLLGAALIGGTISTAPVWASAAVGVATVAGISLAVSTAKQIYNRNIDGK